MPHRRPTVCVLPFRSLRLFLLSLLAIFPALGANSPLHADGWIEIDHPGRRPHPPSLSPPRRPLPTHPQPSPIRLEVTRHHVTADLDRGIASVTVEETFHNPHGRDLEGTYYFPVPPGAQIEDFRAVLGGKELAGEILPADEARRIYETLVRRAIDPAILEYYRRDLFRARVFPIPAHGNVSLTIRYRHRVPSSGGLMRFRYPLDTGRFAHGPYRDVKIDLQVRTDGVLHSVSSPSHALTETARGSHQASLAFRADTLDARHDLLVDIVEGDGVLAGGVRAFQEVGEDGWFLLRLVPSEIGEETERTSNLVLVVDTSGSMAGEKLEQAKAALRSALDRLEATDTFQVVGFSSRVHALAAEPRRATEENLREARGFIDAMIARGGTNIDEAITRAIACARAADLDPTAAPSTVLLITDGAPTVGVTDVEAIARRAREANGGDTRIHVFGVGTQVNTRLLDRVARENRGSRTYLEGTAELEVALGALLDRVLMPSITDLRLTVDGVAIDRLEPPGPWDLFHGDDLVVAGRFSGSGAGHVRLSGIRAQRPEAWTFPATFPAHGGEDEAAYLWAELRIVRLLEELRDRPPERAVLEQELIALSLRYGIVTPYTSYLIREAPAGIVSRRLGRVVRDDESLGELAGRGAAGFTADEGKDAFDHSRRMAEARQRAGSSGDAAGLSSSPESASIDRDVGITKRGGKSFHPVGDRDETIIDGDLGDVSELPEPDLALRHLSDEYFTFLRENPGVEKVLSRGPSILFRWKGKIVRVLPPDLVAPNEETPAPPETPKVAEKKREVFRHHPR